MAPVLRSRTSSRDAPRGAGSCAINSAGSSKSNSVTFISYRWPVVSCQLPPDLRVQFGSMRGDTLHRAAHPFPPTEGAPEEPAPVVVDAPVGIENISLTVLAVIAAVLVLQYAS